MKPRTTFLTSSRGKPVYHEYQILRRIAEPDR